MGKNPRYTFERVGVPNSPTFQIVDTKTGAVLQVADFVPLLNGLTEKVDSLNEILEFVGKYALAALPKAEIKGVHVGESVLKGKQATAADIRDAFAFLNTMAKTRSDAEVERLYKEELARGVVNADLGKGFATAPAIMENKVLTKKFNEDLKKTIERFDRIDAEEEPRDYSKPYIDIARHSDAAPKVGGIASGSYTSERAGEAVSKVCGRRPSESERHKAPRVQEYGEPVALFKKGDVVASLDDLFVIPHKSAAVGLAALQRVYGCRHNLHARKTLHAIAEAAREVKAEGKNLHFYTDASSSQTLFIAPYVIYNTRRGTVAFAKTNGIAIRIAGEWKDL